MNLNTDLLERALDMLSGHLDLAGAPPIQLVVCGGASLLASGVVTRTTKDVDIVALRGADGALLPPVPLPEWLLQAAALVARDLGLEANWLNNGPSRDDGGLFQMGLPAGLAERLAERVYGSRLKVYFIGRRDQIFFKKLVVL